MALRHKWPSVMATLSIQRTPQVTRCLQKAVECTGQKEWKEELEEMLCQEAVPWRIILRAVNEVRDGSNSTEPFAHEVCAGAKLRYPAPPVLARNPQLEERLKAIKKEWEDKKYARMVEDVENKLVQDESMYMASYKEQLGFGLNVMVLMGTLFAVGYVAGQKFAPDSVWPLLGGLLGSMVAMILETLLFITRSHTTTATPGNKKEVKQVVAKKAESKSPTPTTVEEDKKNK